MYRGTILRVLFRRSATIIRIELTSAQLPRDVAEHHGYAPADKTLIWLRPATLSVQVLANARAIADNMSGINNGQTISIESVPMVTIKDVCRCWCVFR